MLEHQPFNLLPHLTVTHQGPHDRARGRLPTVLMTSGFDDVGQSLLESHAAGKQNDEGVLGQVEGFPVLGIPG